MRLQTLQIKNFISIKQATVNFEELNDGVFLISGPTGSGKSSMLDAIHWVLFGKTLSSNRASVSKEIRSSYAPKNEDTVVTLTFNQDKVDYKVIRTLKKDGGTAIQLFAPGIIYDKIKEANEQLEKIIGLSVKQFDQMVMLEQGNFSKFLLADSRTRAEILRDIFDTQLFKEIELRFKDRCDKLKNTILNSVELEKSILQGEMLETVESQITLTSETIRTEQERLIELKNSLKSLQDMLPELIEYDAEYAVYEKARLELCELSKLEKEIQELYERRNVFNDYAPILDWYQDYSRVKQEYDKCQTDAADYRQRIASVVVDEELSDKVATLQKRQSELESILGVFSRIDECKERKNSIEKEITDWQSKIDECLQVKNDNELLQKDITNRIEKRQQYEDKKKEVLKRVQDRHTLQESITELESYIQNNRPVYVRYLSSKLIDISEPGVCPICGEPYTDTHTAEDTGKEVGDFEAKQRSLELQKSKLEDMPELPEPECSEVATLDELRQKLTICTGTLESNEVTLSRAMSQKMTLESTLNSTLMEQSQIEEKVQGMNRSQVQSEFEQVNSEYRELWAKVDDNEMAKRSRNLLEGYLQSVLDKSERLSQQLAELRNRPEALPENDPRLLDALNRKGDVDDFKVNINSYLYKIQHYEMLKDNLLSVEEPVNPHPGYTAGICKLEIQDNNRSIEESIRRISDYQSSLEARKEVVKRIRDLRSVRENDTKAYDEQLYLYNILSGKNNSKISFETFVLHRQLEWILQSSNQYLHTLSAGQFELQVKWESTSARTQGGLEITITDHFTGSTRPAQTYSGGELFMLSLSLSLGLMTSIDSLFTARDLNLLFVDEGFGTLDSECLSRTLMTLRELKNIKSVGIISHVQDLIDTIPQGYLVEKTATGSKIKMFKNL